MGITGLLPALEEISKKRHLKHYEGKRAAVDAYVWLHKAAYQCS
jgi:exonuclease-1